MVGLSAQVAALQLMAESQHGTESSLLFVPSVPTQPLIPMPYGEGNPHLQWELLQSGLVQPHLAAVQAMLGMGVPTVITE